MIRDEDYKKYQVGDRTFPGKFAPYAWVPVQFSARYIYWLNEMFMGGMINLPFNYLLCLGDYATTMDSDGEYKYVAGWNKKAILMKALSDEEAKEYQEAIDAEAAYFAHQEMRAEQGWYDY